jgi:hypothetical protein
MAGAPALLGVPDYRSYMAGPTVDVLLPTGDWTVEQVIAASMDAVRVQAEGPGALPAFDFRDSADLPYALELEPWPPREADEDEVVGVEAAVAFRPRYAVGLIAFVNDPSAHRTLGRLAADLAWRTAGWVDLDGPLGPVGRSSLDTSLTEIHRYVAELALPGQVRSVEYETAAGNQWLFNLLDAEAMRAWLQHPDFHLVK